MFNNGMNGGFGGGFGGPIQGPGGFNSGLNIMGNGNILRNDGTSMGMRVNNFGSIMGVDGTSTGMRIDNFGRINGPGNFNSGYSLPSMSMPSMRKTYDPILPKSELYYREPYEPYKPKDYSLKNTYDPLGTIGSYKKDRSSSYLPDDDYLSPRSKSKPYDSLSYLKDHSRDYLTDPIDKPYSSRKKYDPFQY